MPPSRSAPTPDRLHHRLAGRALAGRPGRPGRAARRALLALGGGGALLAAGGVLAVRGGWVTVDRRSTASVAALAGATSGSGAPGAPTPRTDSAAGTLGDDRSDPTLVEGSGVPGAADSSAGVSRAPTEVELRGTLLVPVAGVARAALRDGWSERRGAGGERQHEALDIPAPRGTPVLAVTDGRVVKLFDSRAGGLTVYTSDASGRWVFLYGHLDAWEPTLREGAPVRRGAVIGRVGSSGNADPAVPHLHFAVARVDSAGRWYGGTPVNPFPLLRE